MIRKDPILEALAPMVERVGYRILGFEDRGEWPEGCACVRITGPHITPNGLPFVVPADNQEVWAKRWCLVLSTSFLAGVARGGDAPALGKMLEPLLAYLGTANENDQAN